MANPDHTASRSQRRSLRRQQRINRSRGWQRRVMRPVAAAVCMALGGAAHISWAGMTPAAFFNMRSIPMPVIPFTDASGKKQNIASYGSGKGTVTVVNAGAANEGVNLQIDQDTQKAIYNWQSFDIGQASAVTFIMGAGKDSSALNRVSNTASASKIFGGLSSYYRDDKGRLVTGGEIFLVNRNGIVFGKNAQVNVGGLIASALDMSDDDYKSGLQSINSVNPTFFKWVDGSGIATYDPATNYVRVEGDATTGERANITTASGGRVYLLGAKVENSGQITSPNGQVVMAAGSEVYLNTPSAEKSPLYMSEANENVPAVKGLLVEVNSQRKAGEVAANTAMGSISTPAGNTTIVGWAVNQSGRISATTSVSQNGSVFLQARSGVRPVSINNGTAFQKYASTGGQLTLGEGSSIEISPDQASASQTVSANTKFTASRVEMSGQTIDIQKNASIKAPGAVVNIRAESTPSYKPDGLVEKGGGSTDTAGRLTLGDGVTIDVSGTKDTTVSVARNFVTTALLGATDLKDAPIQKDGPLYRSKLTFDIRQAAPILGDTSSYKNAVQTSANEFMAKGGSVSLTATGAVVTSNTASLDVSGGQVTYTSALVNPSMLLGQNGQRYTLNTAPVDQVYVGVAGVGAMTPTRFGSRTAPNLAGLTHVEAGYVQGSDGGSLNVVAPKVVLDAKLSGGTVGGQRQLAGIDALAASSRLSIGSIDNTLRSDAPALFGSALFQSASLGNFTVTRGVPAGNATEGAPLPESGRVSASQLNGSGFGSVTIASNENITIEDGADLKLPQQGSLTLRAAGSKGIDLGGDIDLTGGTVSVQAMSRNLAAAAIKSSGTVVLHEGKHIDVSGNWVNQRLDGADVAGAVAGGKVTLSSGHGLKLGVGSTIDVSGGATMNSSGAVKGSDAGAISLLSNTEPLDTKPGSMGVFEMGASLKGFGISKGGSLTMQAGSVELVNSTGTASSIKQGVDTGSIVMGADFFTQGGFQTYSVEGVASLKVVDNTTLAPRTFNWAATPALRNLATGGAFKNLAQVLTLPDGQRAPANLTLMANGVSAKQSGVLTVGQGAQIIGDPGAKLALRAGLNLDMNGAMKAAGGQVSVTLNGRAVLADSETPGILHLGAQASLDASGTTVYQPSVTGQLIGVVQDGGAVTVGVNTGTNTRSALLVDEGASLKANGAVGTLDVATPLGLVGPAFTRQTVASNGGAVQLNYGKAGGTLSSNISAQAGNATAVGGSFGLNMADASTGTIRVQKDGAGSAAFKAGEVSVSSSAIQAGGFADVSLLAPQEINFKTDMDWAIPRSLTLNTPLVSVAGTSDVKLSAGSTLLMGRSGKLGNAVTQLSSTSDSKGQLTLQGGLVGLFGQQAVQGVQKIQVNAGAEVRLIGASEEDAASKSGNLPGGLLTRGDVSLHAPQVTVASASNYTLDASGATVTIDGGDANSAAPLSAGGKLTIKAATINQNGVLRVPFGSVVFKATDAIHLGAGLTSVSGSNLLVPFGSTTGGGTTLSYMAGGTMTAPVEKSIVLDASGKAVDVSSLATLDLSGGGATVAYEFVPGPGGSKDIFAGSLNGSFAVVPSVQQYAPTDAAILALRTDSVNQEGISQTRASSNPLSLGNTITFGNNGMVPAGTYAILPARYALLPGAYLVKPVSGSGAVSLNYKQGQTDGSAIVGGVLGTTGVNSSNRPATGFVVMSSQSARRYSEIKMTSLDAYFTDQAAFAGIDAPRLAADAGRLSIVAAKAQLDGNIQFAHEGGLGGQLDLSSSNIHVGAGAQADALNVTYDQLNKTGADSVVLGGIRQTTSADGVTQVTVAAGNVIVDADPDAQGQARSLTVGDLSLVATNSVKLRDGVQISAATTGGKAAKLNVSGNGALLRVSGDANASTTRDVSGVKKGELGATGDLALGHNVSLSGGTVVAEATRLTNMASNDGSSVAIQASKVVIGAQRMVMGNAPSDAVSGNTLVVSDRLLTQFNQTKDLTLRSFGGVDMYQGTTLGTTTTRSLTIDSANLRVKGADTRAQIQAGGVQLLNTTGSAADDGALDLGTLAVTATGLAGGNGHITVGGGNISISGSSSTQLSAAGSVVLAGNGGVSTPGDLQIAAGSLTVQQGAVSNIQSGGWVRVSGPAEGMVSTAQATPGLGAQVNISAYTIDQQGKVVLPSGALNLAAKYQLRFGAQSSTDLSGSTRRIDGVALDSMGGTLVASSRLADVTQLAGAVLDVSAGGGGGRAGSMSFSATQGSVKLQGAKGSVLARSNAQQQGGSLSIDSGKAVDLQALSANINAGQTDSSSNFGQSISVRTRLKGQDLDVTDQTRLTSANIDLSADLADVNINGALRATSQSGGSIKVSAGGDVRLNASADLQAHADAGNKSVQTTGGLIELSSSGMTRSDGALGTVKLLGGSINTAGLNGGQDGKLKVRASTAAWLADKSAVGTSVAGTRAVTVEAVKVLQATVNAGASAAVVDQATQEAAKAYVSDLFDQSGGNSKAGRIAARMAGLKADAQVRAGVEIQSTGDMSLDSDINLISWRSGADDVLTAAPVNVTLRAGGTLNVNHSISDGFLNVKLNTDLSSGVPKLTVLDATTVSPYDFVVPGLGGDISLVGGADLKAANALSTKAGSTGDVLIGGSKIVTSDADSLDHNVSADVLVRTTTGNIKVAASRDVSLLNPKAVVYTTGQAVADNPLYVDRGNDVYASLDGYAATAEVQVGEIPTGEVDADGNPITKLVYMRAAPFMQGGGSVSVIAGRDVISKPSTDEAALPQKAVQQYATDWWWRVKMDDGSLAWWNRYDLFQQGFGTFGGGNVLVQAGRDAWNVSASAAAGGYRDGAGTHSFGGGNVGVLAGRDVVGGVTFAAGDTTVVAGRNITSQTSLDSGMATSNPEAPSGLMVLYGNGQTQVMARNRLVLGNLTQAGMLDGVVKAQPANFALAGLVPDAVVRVASVAGNLQLTNAPLDRYAYSDTYQDDQGTEVPARSARSTQPTPLTVLAADTSMQAGEGSLTNKSDVYQTAAIRNQDDGKLSTQGLNLSLLARDDLTIKSVTQFGADLQAGTPSALLSSSGGAPNFSTNFTKSIATTSTLLGGNVHNPVRVVAQEGDVSFENLDLKQGLHLIAGNNIQADRAAGGIRLQHQDDDAVSLIQSGRDLNLSLTAFGIEANGPGNVVVAVGRSFNLNESDGLRAQGNRSNNELPAKSAALTVLTGISFAKGDVTSAGNAYFELLGGSGVGDFAPDLFAQISAVDQGQTVPGLGSAAAKAFAALSVGEQVSRARGIVGDAAYQQRVLSYMQHRESPSLSLPAALAAFDALSDADKAPVVGLLLTSAWSSKVAQATQIDTVMSMAASRGNPYSDQLVSFMQQRTGQVLTPQQAALQFKALDPQEQVLLSAKVLVSEMSAAVSKASNLTGQAKTAAYLNAYNALDTMFPSAAVNRSDLQMGASTIQTQQGSGISVFSPNGAINVGQLTATAAGAEASKLGLITAGGGDMAVVARDDVLVNQSRIFTVGKGDELIWSSTGNVDAGRGGKTVTAAASPVFYLDPKGQLQVDVTSAIAGSGIASSGKARIAAPKGEINAGDAGISASGGLELAATVVRGADNIQAPSISGAPAPAPVNTALAAPTPNQPTAAGAKDASDNDESKSRKRKKRNILLDFLGFGTGNEG